MQDDAVDISLFTDQVSAVYRTNLKINKLWVLCGELSGSAPQPEAGRDLSEIELRHERGHRVREGVDKFR